jgi:penicillin-binding protein 2
MDDLVLTLLTAVGSADVRVTPVQVAMAYAALANGGRLYAPQLVDRIQSSLGQVLEQRTPVLRRTLHVSPASLALVREGMRRAVNQAGGTAHGARKGLVVMAGKTGTSDVTRPAAFPHAWFAGWAPADRPEIAVVALVDSGGVGGLVAAPIARAIVDAYFARGARHNRR